LMMWLPGEIAKRSRAKAAEILVRYCAGDASLIAEIEANAKSSSPVAHMARESLGIMTEEELTRKRRREELELEMLQIEMEERKSLVEERKVKMIETQQKGLESFIQTMAFIDSNWKNDTRLVIQTKDRLKNIVLGQSPAAITNGPSDTPIYIHDVARSLGYGKLSHGDACKIGKKAAELYHAIHSSPPQKRMQFVDGAERMVNVYTESDRPMLERAVHAVFL